MLLAESVRPNGDILSRKLIDLGSAPASRRDLAAHGGQSWHRQKQGRTENSAVIRAWRKILKGEQPSRPGAVAAFSGPNRLSLEARSFGACQRRSPVVTFPITNRGKPASDHFRVTNHTSNTTTTAGTRCAGNADTGAVPMTPLEA
jgi:hypothetical protein